MGEDDDEAWRTVNGIRVLAFSYTAGGVVDAVLLSEDGVPVDTYRFTTMTRSGFNICQSDFEEKVIFTVL